MKLSHRIALPATCLLLGVLFLTSSFAGEERASTEKRKVAEEESLYETTNIIGCKVRNQQGDEVGKVEDLVLDLPADRAAYAVISFRGLPDTTGKLYAVPWQCISVVAPKKEVQLGLEKDRLKGAPGFQRDAWPDMSDSKWVEDMHAFYGLKPTGGTGGREARVKAGLFRASALLGCTAQDRGMDSLGKMEDIFLASTNGRLTYALLGSGGTLGFGEKLFPIPWSAVTVKASEKPVALMETDKEKLKNAPTFKRSELPKLSDRALGATIHRFYGKTPYWEASILGTRVTSPRVEVAKIQEASAMIRNSVINHLGERLGEVKDILVDIDEGCIAYAVLSTGGFLGSDGKLVAVPWKALTLKPEEKAFLVHLEKEKLKGAPALDPGRVTEDLASRDRGGQVHAYYGMDPYWKH